MDVHDGIPEIFGAAREAGLRIGVVSNNPQSQILETLETAGLAPDVVVGNDQPGLRKKPAPDTYAEAAKRLGFSPATCVAVEDSLLGAEAGHAAGCHTVAVATGANSFRDLSESTFVSRCYVGFARCYVALRPGGVTQKLLSSPDEFVSYLLENVSGQLGCSIDLSWTNDDWYTLGKEFGREVRKFPVRSDSASTVDNDGAEFFARCEDAGKVVVDGSHQVDLIRFLDSGVEQLSSGRPLVVLIDGICHGAGIDLSVKIPSAKISSAEDPRHTWESIFSGLGTVLDRMVGDRSAAPNPQKVTLA
jgi:hypothetical protein